MGLWVIDRTNKRGNEVYDRNIARHPMPRQAAEVYVAWLKERNPDNYYAVREEEEERQT